MIYASLKKGCSIMASWLTHLRVAEKIKQKIPEIDFSYFIIGSIAPDSEEPEDDSISKMDDSVFFDSYLKPEKIMTRSDSTRSFLWGYYFHLITDKLWLEDYFRPLSLQYKSESDNEGTDFVDFMGEEMTSIDFEYLKENGRELVDNLKEFNGNINYLYEFDSDCIFECKDRIVGFYNGEPPIFNREYKYLTPQKLDEFIVKASEKCVSILII